MRTIKEIYNSIITEKETLSNLDGLLPASTNYSDLLSDLTTGSKVAIWRLWAFVVAAAIWVHEGLVDALKTEIQTISDGALAGTLLWYRNEVLKFQYNYSLEWIDNKYQYAAIDADAQIVTQAAVVENGSTLLVKAAKGVAPALEALSAAELAALQGYVSQIKFAGTAVVVSSNDADDLKLYYEVFYNATLPQATVQANVEAAIVAYIQNLPFNNVLKVSKLTDEIQKNEGVDDVVFESAAGKYGVLPYTAFTRTYQSNAGYAAIDAAFPLSTTITYTAS